MIINHDYITIINHHYPILNQCSSHHQAVNQMICKTQHPKPLKDHAGSCRSYKNRVADTLSMARSKQILLQKKNANRPNLDTHPVFHVSQFHVPHVPHLSSIKMPIPTPRKQRKHNMLEVRDLVRYHL